MEKASVSSRQEFIWQTPEYEHYERGSNWFWTVGVLGFVGIILSIIFKNFLLAIILGIGLFSVFMYAHRPPEVVTVVVNKRGVLIKDEFYPFRNIKAFAINHEKEPAHLSLHIHRLVMPHVQISLENINPDEIQTFLRSWLDQEEYEETFIEVLAEKIGF